MLLCAKYVLPIAEEAFSNGAVLVRDGVIADVGNAGILKRLYPDEEVRDFGDAALMPGLISTHIRLEDSMMRGLVNEAPYVLWVSDMHRLNEKASASDWYESAVFGSLEAVRYGITCVADTTASGASRKAISDVGLRGLVFREVSAMDKGRIDRAMRTALEDIKRWTQDSDSDLISVGLTPGSMYMCHPEIFTRVTQAAVDQGLPVSIHLSGSREVYNFIKYGSSPFSVAGTGQHRGYVEMPPWLPTGVSPVKYAQNWGAFDAPHVIARHCVQVDDNDISILAAKNVQVSVCPRFNAQLGMGVAPIMEFERQGVPYALGNDSPAATEGIDLFVEMRLALLMSRALNTRFFMTSAEMLRKATLDAAAVLGLDDHIGSLEMGKKADIIAIDFKRFQYAPAVDPESFIINNCSGNDVLMTMVQGNVVYDHGEWAVNEDLMRRISRMEDTRKKLQK